MVPMPVMALYFGSVPVWARSITGTGIQKWCPHRYRHFCTLVQYQYGQIPLLVLAFNYARTGTGDCVLWFSTSRGTVHYRYWHSMMPVKVLAILYLGLVPVWARSITGTGIQLCFYRYWHFCHVVHYLYGQIPSLVLTINDARTIMGISALWFSIIMGTFHY